MPTITPSPAPSGFELIRCRHGDFEDYLNSATPEDKERDLGFLDARLAELAPRCSFVRTVHTNADEEYDLVMQRRALIKEDLSHLYAA